MVAEVLSGMVHGITGEIITVQTDISEGLPMFNVIGYLSAEVKEAKERVRTALKNSGFRLPPKRIAANLAPADIRKSGTNFDLAIAVGLLAAMGLIAGERVKGILFLGELALDGTLFPVTGVLPLLKAAREKGCISCILPADNLEEASLLSGLRIFGFRHLKEVFLFLTTGELSGGICTESNPPSFSMGKEIRSLPGEINGSSAPDLAQVKGQAMAKRALEIAVSGFHNLFLDGPPGAGKTMLASCVPGIMPLMEEEEIIDATMIYSVRGLLENHFSPVSQRPFRCPSSSVTMAGMFGGGRNPRPGEVSLAHHGVLFLDEFPEFKKEVIEMFRIPLEEHRIVQVRNGRTMVFPADFLFIAAANPCPCGYYPDRKYCRCSRGQVTQYQNRISGPILDRLDLFVRCDSLPYGVLLGEQKEETSKEVRQRIERVWKIQRMRYQKTKIKFNGRMGQKEMKRYCVLDHASQALLEKAFETFHMTGRTCHRILKVSRTIADMAGEEAIKKEHVQEALLYRRTSFR